MVFYIDFIYNLIMQIPSEIKRNKEGQYCLNCYSKRIKRIFKQQLTYYYCPSCKMTSERSLVIDNKIEWWVDKNNNYWHESVGVLVIVNGKLLTLLRQIYPFVYSIPAGHLDKNEEPEIAARRELKEETNISALALKIKKTDFNISGDSCRRGSDDHCWNLYSLKLDSLPKIIISDEASKIKWMSLEDLKSEYKISYPLQFFVNTFGEELFL
jgi:8-oxo-dGTP pyrophosphatase MutT (NUDIX family)